MNKKIVLCVLLSAVSINGMDRQGPQPQQMGCNKTPSNGDTAYKLARASGIHCCMALTGCMNCCDEEILQCWCTNTINLRRMCLNTYDNIDNVVAACLFAGKCVYVTSKNTGTCIKNCKKNCDNRLKADARD